MTALFTWCLRSQATSWRCPWALVGQLCRNANVRMHASTLSLDTSIPTTTRSFCAIIHSLPCSVRARSPATVRVEEDTGAVPRSVTGSNRLGAQRAQFQQRAVGAQPPVRTFCQILWTQGRRESRAPTAPASPCAEVEKDAH